MGKETGLTAHGGSILMPSCAKLVCTMLLNVVNPMTNTLFHRMISTRGSER
jgi:hypothetical protein